MQGIIVENIANLYQVKPIHPKEEITDKNIEKQKSCQKGPSPMAQTRNQWQPAAIRMKRQQGEDLKKRK